MRYVTALRKYRQEDPPRGLHVQLMVFDVEEEAEKSIRSFRTNYVRYPGVTTQSEREIDDVSLPGLAGVYVWERENSRGDYHGFARYIAGRVKNVSMLVVGSAGGAGWDWDQLVAVASRQVSKLQETDDGSSAT